MVLLVNLSTWKTIILVTILIFTPFQLKKIHIQVYIHPYSLDKSKHLFLNRSYIVLAQDNSCLYMYLILEFLGTTWDLK